MSIKRCAIGTVKRTRHRCKPWRTGPVLCRMHQPRAGHTERSLKKHEEYLFNSYEGTELNFDDDYQTIPVSWGLLIVERDPIKDNMGFVCWMEYQSKSAAAPYRFAQARQ